MKKIFTLAVAVAAVLTANAVPVRKAVLRSADAQAVIVPREARAQCARMSAGVSRAEDLSGTYVDGIMEGIFDGGTAVGQLGIRDQFVMDADPEVENGYIIHNFLESILFDEQNPGHTNDLKAEYNPVTRVLSIPGRQVLFTDELDEYGTVDFLMLTCASTEDLEINEDLPIQFEYDNGVFTLLSPSIEFGNRYGDQNGILSLNIGVANFSAWIPNGEMSYYSVREQKNVTVPVYGININGENLIYNFGDADALNPTTFVRDGDKVEYRYKFHPLPGDPRYYAAAFIANYYPSLYPEANVLDYFYLSEVEPKGNDEYLPVTNPIYDYYLQGEAEKNTATECVLNFPPFGFYDENDVVWNIYTDVAVSYNPSAVAGIGNVITEAVGAEAPVVYYNLQGMRVNNPENGIFIRQQGTESTKVLLK